MQISEIKWALLSKKNEMKTDTRVFFLLKPKDGIIKERGMKVFIFVVDTLSE